LPSERSLNWIKDSQRDRDIAERDQVIAQRETRLKELETQQEYLEQAVANWKQYCHQVRVGERCSRGVKYSPVVWFVKPLAARQAVEQLLREANRAAIHSA